MAELGAIRKYHYWSDRRIRALATANNIDLTQRWRFSAGLSIPYHAQIGFARDARELHQHEVAQRMEEAIGQLAVEDFVTPPPTQFAKGIGRVEFARDGLNSGPEMGGVMHALANSSEGARVDVCMFGSIENFSDHLQQANYMPQGWTSSSFRTVRELIYTHGNYTDPDYDDEALAVEALGIVLWQGITRHEHEHAGKPWTRGFTVGAADDAEWIMEVYKDVSIDRQRWSRGDVTADRILIGAPLWIRTAPAHPVELYHGEPHGAQRRQDRRRLRRRRAMPVVYGKVKEPPRIES